MMSPPCGGVQSSTAWVMPSSPAFVRCRVSSSAQSQRSISGSCPAGVSTTRCLRAVPLITAPPFYSPGRLHHSRLPLATECAAPAAGCPPASDTAGCIRHDPATIRQALSHPQALAQTAGFLRARGLEPVPSGDTAGSARLIREGDLHGKAAVAGRRAAEFYGLRILAENIEDNPHNYTKFLVLARNDTPTGPGTFNLQPS